MPVGYGIGDHRVFILDVLTSSMVGLTPPMIIRSQARRLNTKIPGVEKRYLKVLEELVRRHRFNERLATAYANGTNAESVKIEANKIDRGATACMKKAKKKCRRIKSGRIPFSPESSILIRRCQV